ncbi:uncharacterized protein CC84DRAFT_1168385 [Paraphaeosphaeria sporulosa]|uniref:Uncharacterized protein n=1 Tax=Paraphaeosphaeria sporulosa TaxID=1460663 RepID=A0A177BXL9_9PLEO|nr:uncharacterized protein CC84DRAFT_1168385 [Paraphaeosphaeria sporulosa]OAG00264.1 hypothetical protein CC84DRAFT_1168385 [Paraphaeosphaeria sporulosa]
MVAVETRPTHWPGIGKAVNLTSTILMNYFGMWRLIVYCKTNARLDQAECNASRWNRTYNFRLE